MVLDRKILLMLAVVDIQSTLVSKVQQLPIVLRADRRIDEWTDLGTLLRQRIRSEGTGNNSQRWKIRRTLIRMAVGIGRSLQLTKDRNHNALHNDEGYST